MQAEKEVDPGAKSWHFDRRINIFAALSLLFVGVGAAVGGVWGYYELVGTVTDTADKVDTMSENVATTEALARLERKFDELKAASASQRDVADVRRDIDDIERRQDDRENEMSELRGIVSQQSELLARLDERFVAIIGQLTRIENSIERRETNGKWEAPPR